MTLILNGDTGLSDVDGSAATPAIRGTDSNTGIFFPAADTIAFSEGGAEVARFDSSGNLGIGTSSPSFKLDVSGTGRFTGLTQFDNGINLKTATLNYVYFDDALAFSRNGTGERMRIDTSGNLQFNSGYGSVATAFGCRAWVNFNGTGTVAIRASGNVTSITDGGVGTYTVNLTTAMPDANYAVTGTRVGVGSTADASISTSITSTSAVSVITGYNGTTGNTYTLEDPSQVFIAIFR